MRRSIGWKRVALLPLLLAGAARAQLLPPPPPAAEPVPSVCVSRYGNTGCAARLYAGLLCEAMAADIPVETLQLRLEQLFEEAAIDFNGITPAQVETAAVRYYAPMLCSGQSRRLQELFAAPSAAGAGS